jgi:outer membrane immunogenic protein
MHVIELGGPNGRWKIRGAAIALVVAAGLNACIGAAALAADVAPPVPVYTKTPAPQPTYNWTGFYLGVHAGGIWSSSTDNVTPGNSAAVTFFVPSGQLATSLPLSSSAFIGGGQLGHNWQINPTWVAGFEADFSGTDLGNKVSLPAPDGGTRMMTANETLDWFGTIRGRIGVTPTDRALWYFTGGLAYAHANLATTLTRTTGCSGNNCQAGAVSGTKTGWTIGGGLEWAFADNLSFKTEYLYYDLGTLSHSMTDPFFPAIFNASADIKGSIARVGLNYKFSQ